MKNKIIHNLHEPIELEKLYRGDEVSFTNAFDDLVPAMPDELILKVWSARLNYEKERTSWGTNVELLIVLLISGFAGLLAKVPQFISLNEELFYSRNTGFIVFAFLSVYFIWQQKPALKTILIIATTFVVSAIYINMLPPNVTSDTIVLACIHLTLFLWSLTGLSFMGNDFKNSAKRLDYLRYNGDLVVMTTIVLIAGGIMTGITLGLFDLIGIRAEEFYFNNVVILGLAAAPIVVTHLVRKNPQLISKVSPVIAKVFTPLVLLTLIIYLVAVVVTGKDPYNNREFLLIFNGLLIGVLAIILFSVAENAKNSGGRFAISMLAGLSAVTIIVNGIALSAIIFRISEWGITPNRLAVLGGNILILINLLLVTYRLFKSAVNPQQLNRVEDSIAGFLPVYSIWTAVVTFIFPLIFNFR